MAEAQRCSGCAKRHEAHAPPRCSAGAGRRLFDLARTALAELRLELLLLNPLLVRRATVSRASPCAHACLPACLHARRHWGSPGGWPAVMHAAAAAATNLVATRVRSGLLTWPAMCRRSRLAEFMAYCLSYCFVTSLVYMARRLARGPTGGVTEFALPAAEHICLPDTQPPAQLLAQLLAQLPAQRCAAATAVPQAALVSAL